MQTGEAGAWGERRVMGRPVLQTLEAETTVQPGEGGKGGGADLEGPNGLTGQAAAHRLLAGTLLGASCVWPSQCGSWRFSSRSSGCQGPGLLSVETESQAHSGGGARGGAREGPEPAWPAGNTGQACAVGQGQGQGLCPEL